MIRFELSKKQRESLFKGVEALNVGVSTAGSGFRRYTSAYRNINAYLHVESGVVVKKFAFILDDDTPKSLRIPTIELGGGWVAQPVCSKIRLRRAADMIENRAIACRKRGVTPDIHVGNVGWWRGLPWLFDW